MQDQIEMNLEESQQVANKLAELERVWKKIENKEIRVRPFHMGRISGLIIKNRRLLNVDPI